jgi:hypothetical protein
MANRPIKKWRSGNVEAAIWLNEKEKNGTKIEFKTLSLTRNWKKKDDNVWRSDVLNLRRMDIPKIMILLQKAQEELFLAEEPREKEKEEE